MYNQAKKIGRVCEKKLIYFHKKICCRMLITYSKYGTYLSLAYMDIRNVGEEYSLYIKCYHNEDKGYAMGEVCGTHGLHEKLRRFSQKVSRKEAAWET
jgi:hypothetical protein